MVAMAGGGLDLLDDESRGAADLFAERYRALRIHEGWVDPTGRDPNGGRPEIWGRLKSTSKAATILAREWPIPAGQVVADIGSGTGWALRLFEGFGVIAFDILPTTATRNALHVRADMRKLPLRDRTIDAAFFVASLHYAPARDAVREAARVLRPGGLLVVVDSPICADSQSQARAAERSAAYYADAGYAELAAHYHPIEIGVLRSALAESGFAVDRLSAEGPVQALWHRLVRRPPATLLVARQVRR
jgi:SAM-dependent methyltransferase